MPFLVIKIYPKTKKWQTCSSYFGRMIEMSQQKEKPSVRDTGFSCKEISLCKGDAVEYITKQFIFLS